MIVRLGENAAVTSPFSVDDKHALFLMLPEHRSEFLYITAGDNKWRAGVDAGSERRMREARCMLRLGRGSFQLG